MKPEDRQAPVAIGSGVRLRTCAGCRARSHQDELLRLAVSGERVAIDPRRRLPGRGAYVHRRQVCIERAFRKGGLSRDLRTQLPSPAVVETAMWWEDPARTGRDGTVGHG